MKLFHSPVISLFALIAITHSSSLPAAVVPLNHPPVPDASATDPIVVSLNGINATVILDASESTDPDGDSPHYSWFESGSSGPLGHGLLTTAVLPLGTYSLSLVANDGAATRTNVFSLQVMTPQQCLEHLIELAGDSTAHAQPLKATLNAALASLAKGNPTAAMNQLQAFQNKVAAQIARSNPALAEALTHLSQQVIDSLNGNSDHLVTAAVSPFEIDLAWQNASAPNDGYKVERSTDGFQFNQIAQPLPGTTTFHDLNLFPDTAYHYRVRAFRGSKSSTFSNVSNCRTPAANCALSILSWGAQPAAPPVGLQGVVALAAGSAHALALKSDGTVVGWGDNSFGQSIPPSNLTGVVAISAGLLHSLALKSDGTVIAWGDNSYGQATPSQKLTNIVAIAAGSFYNLGLKTDGTVLAWGDSNSPAAYPPPQLAGVVAIAAGSGHALALKSDGTVVSWGNDFSSPPSSNLTSIIAIAANGDHSLALKADGTVIAWGNDFWSQMDFPTGLSGVIALAAGEHHSIAIKGDHSLVAWGNNGWGQAFTPATHGAVAVAAGGYQSLALTTTPPVPLALKASIATSNQVSLTWEADNQQIESVLVERLVSGSEPFDESWVVIGTASAGVTNLTDATVTLGSSYVYRIRARNACGDSPPTFQVGINVGPPVAPVSLQTAIGTTNRVDVSWYDYSGNGDGFYLERAPDTVTGPGAWSLIATIKATNSFGEPYFYPDAPIVGNSSYWYRIRAFNILGSSPYSDTAYIRIVPPSGVPAINAIVRANQINLSWFDSEALSQGVTRYAVEKAADAGGQPGTWTEIASVSNLNNYSFSYSETALVANVTFWYRVRAFNWVGASPYSTPIAVTVLPPAQPSSLGAYIGLSNAVDLAWSDYATDQDGFKVERAPDEDGFPGDWTEIGTVPTPNMYSGYFSDTNALAQTTMWYRVRAYNIFGYSEYSAPASVQVVAPPTPMLGASTFGNRVNLNFSTSYNGFQGFRIERAADNGGVPGSWQEIANLAPALSAYGYYTDPDRAADTTYWYRVRAYNWIGDSPYSDPLKTTIVPPGAPVSLLGYLGDTNQVTVSWVASYPYDEDGFYLERAPDVNGSPGNWTALATVLNTNTYAASWTDSNAVAHTTNWYRVRSFNSVGVSSNSDPISIGVEPPPVPASIFGYQLANTVNLFWNEFYVGQLGGFELERAPDAGGAPGLWRQITTTSGNSYLDVNLAANTTYWYRVRAYNWVGNSPYSVPTSFTILPPAAPQNVAGYITETNHARIEWSADSDAEGYRVERAADHLGQPGVWQEFAVVFATNLYPSFCTDSNVVANTTNWYRVRAFNVLGLSAYSEPGRLDIIPPPTPQYLYAQAFSNSINLSWYEEYLGVVGGYEIERAPDLSGVPGPWEGLATTTNADTTFTDVGLAINTTWWYRVRAYTWVGHSSNSVPSSATISLPRPPSYISATVAPSNNVAISWYPEYPGDQDGFRLDRATDVAGVPGTWTEITSFTSPGYDYVTYFDPNVTANTTNWYRVRAYNVLGLSDYSQPASVYILPPGTPPDLFASVGGPHRVDLSMYAYDGPVEGFKVDRAPDMAGSPGTWSALTTVLSSFYGFYSDESVTNGQAYWYRARTFSWVGESPSSPLAFVEVKVPAAPTSLTASNDWRNQISLNWSAPSNTAPFDGYKLDRAQDQAGIPVHWSQIATVPYYLNSYGDRGLQTNKTYWYRIRAYNNAGDSPDSNLAHAEVRSGQFVRVMQWNVERHLGRQGALSSASTAIASVVNFNQPDVLLFNEIDTQNLTTDQNVLALIQWVTNAVPYLGSQPGDSFYVAVSSQSDGFIRNGVISRYPIVSPTTYDDGLRGLHSFQVQLSPGNALQIFHAHLKCCADDCGRKQTEAQFDADTIAAFAATNALPYIFAGDWNEEDEKPVPLCPLSSDYHPITTIRQGAGLAEFKPVMLSGEYRTWSSQDSTPSVRFDYVLPATNRLAPIGGFVFSSSIWASYGLYSGAYYDSYYASDHYCVFANYLFQEPRLVVSPGTLASSGYQGGPFSPVTQPYTLSNATTAPLIWSAGKSADWLSLSSSGGTLAPGGTTTISLSLTTNAGFLGVGMHPDTLSFTNLTEGTEVITRAAVVTILPQTRLVVTPTRGLSAIGTVGGPFAPASQVYTLSNAGIATLVWNASVSANWLSLSATNGSLAAGAVMNLTAAVQTNANSLPAATYSAAIAFSNQTDGYGDTSRSATLSVINFGFFDDFSQFAAGNLVGQRGWSQLLSASGLPLRISAGQLGIPFGQTTDNQDAYKNFTVTNTTLFYGLAMTITNATFSGSPSYFAALYTGNNASGFANFRLSARDNGGNSFLLAARITGQAGDPYTFGSTPLAYGAPHRVIVQANAGGTVMEVFVDPASPDPASQTAEIVNFVGGGSPPPSVGSLVVSQFGSASVPTVGANFSRIAVSDSFADVYNFIMAAPVTPLSQSSIPLAAAQPELRITSIDVSGQGVRLTWSTWGGATNIVQVSAAPNGVYSNLSPALVMPGLGTFSTNYFDSGTLTNNSARYYRVRAL